MSPKAPYSSFHAPNWDSIELISNRRHSPICILNDDVLLHIFHLYRLDVQYEYNDLGGYPMSSWRGQRWWYDLVHVSRRWRDVILASPLRLDLHLVCTSDVPVADMLAHSPPLPLTVWYSSGYPCGYGTQIKGSHTRIGLEWGADTAHPRRSFIDLR